MNQCYHCKAYNIDGVEFCDDCGTRLSRVAPPTPSVTPTFNPVVIPPNPSGGKARRYWEKLFRSRSTSFETVVETRSDSPFAIYRDKCEVTVPLLQSFRFVHEPIGFTSGAQFVGRRNEMESLAERILFSEGGSFLVTGYRGVGKTSFVNQVIRKLEVALPWARPLLGETEIVDIYLNMARPVQPSEIMHHIIRSNSGLIAGSVEPCHPEMPRSSAASSKRWSIQTCAFIVHLPLCLFSSVSCC
jgi:hypothetical protein